MTLTPTSQPFVNNQSIVQQIINNCFDLGVYKTLKDLISYSVCHRLMTLVLLIENLANGFIVLPNKQIKIKVNVKIKLYWHTNLTLYVRLHNRSNGSDQIGFLQLNRLFGKYKNSYLSNYDKSINTQKKHNLDSKLNNARTTYYVIQVFARV